MTSQEPEAHPADVNGAALRVEHDVLGDGTVPRDALYGLQTVRAQANFAAGGMRLCEQPAFLAALAQVKTAAALANIELGAIEPAIGDAIARAAREVAAGEHRHAFPLEIVQGGGGTSTNMNVNEVLANRAGELLGDRRGAYVVVHPNDHVNRSQSTNDVLPTAMSIAVHVIAGEALAALGHLERRLTDQAVANEGLDHLGRTCLQDAVPLPVAAVHHAQAHTLARAEADHRQAADRLLAVPLGATAVGTGLGAPAGYRDSALAYLARETGLSLRPADNPYDGLASLEPFAAVADAMARAARVMARIAADIRLLASGPSGGIGEIELPAVQTGSSIMPGKVNPVMPELVMQTHYELAGAAHAVQLATAAGELEVTPMGPIVTAELLAGLQRLGRVAVLFADRCIVGLVWRRHAVEANLGASLQPAVESAVAVGYDAAAAAVRAGRAGDEPAMTSEGE
jgi:aspartate ammonia-lyase